MNKYRPPLNEVVLRAVQDGQLPSAPLPFERVTDFVLRIATQAAAVGVFHERGNYDEEAPSEEDIRALDEEDGLEEFAPLPDEEVGDGDQ